MTLLEEIREQPAVLQGLLDHARTQVAAVANAIRARRVQYVYLVARGTSEHAGIYGQYVFGAFNGLPVALGAPSLFTVYERPPQVANALVVGVSQSGQSPDIVAVLAEGRRQGALTLAITNDPQSPLAEAAELSLAIQAGPERAVAATKTYTGELMLFAMLSAALADDPAMWVALERVPAAAAEALLLDPEIVAAAEHFRAMRECVVLGRGFHFATALEWSLKLKELAYVIAERYSTAEFQHGPIALVEPGFAILAVAPTDPGLAPVRDLLIRMRANQGAQLLILSDDPATLKEATVGLRLPTGVAPWLMPLVSIIPAQLFCHHLTIARGLNPATPRGLNKVTLTH
ncbi:SIS domain-containing protein [Candidatus Chloroploca asiatica]|uniref:Glucosamine--fructose-6-phosphate aminotransferase n=1 Tax=Candidatus Chloroploca asiatica TaxID=1506545 RepID=A0A2H3KWR1_9CHLR|nr:SIS domain-containing protein [Candidatus Chloroploca asiatica]PDV98389.1 glucosamine--fructose-6-phosphate aminotransferase [Candidatus Chloroploca asiatica]